MKILYFFSLVFACYIIAWILCYFFSFRFDLPTPQSLQACLSYRSREAYESESCERKQNYICKNHLIYSINSQER